MTLNMSACNYKSTVSMSFTCKQIWLPPLFPTLKGSICVTATLAKMNELLEVFVKLLRGFVCHSDRSIEQDVWDLGCLPELPNPCSGQGGQLWLWHIGHSAGLWAG